MKHDYKFIRINVNKFISTADVLPKSKKWYQVVYEITSMMNKTHDQTYFTLENGELESAYSNEIVEVLYK